MFENYVYRDIPEESTNKVDVYEYPPIDFCFVGSRGVGKTSLLASMAKELRKGNVTSFYVDTKTQEGRHTASALNGAYEDMVDMLDNADVGEIIPMGGIAATSIASREFIFKGRYTDGGWLRDKQFRFPFRFIDMPGGWYEDDGGHEQEVGQILTHSAVSFLAIDTPAMMESGDSVHTRLNHPDKIYDWYQENIETLARQGHAVIIVLSRCEAFWEKKDEMLRKFKERYVELLGLFQKAGLPVCLVPVKTLGGVKFVAYDKSIPRMPRAQFMRTGKYEPENCVTPLKIAFIFGLLRIFQQIRENQDIWDWITDTIGFTHFDNAENCVRGILSEIANIDEESFWGGEELYQ